MNVGRLVVVVGPSGVGKDTLIAAMAKALPELVVARRVITRAAGAVGEDHDPVSEALFDARLALGQYAVHWAAHGLRYAIPVRIDAELAAGRWVVFNGSRRALPAIRARYPTALVLSITATPESLAQRLHARGRESARQIAARLKRASMDPPVGAHVIVNDGPIEEALAQILQVISRATQGA